MADSVVLVHGLRTSSTMWRAQMEALQEAGYAVSAPDLPGHGTRMAERFSLDGALATIGEAVDAAPGETFLCGFSLGGYLSLHWAGSAVRPVSGILAAACGTTPYRVALDAWRLTARVIHRFPDRGLAFNNWAVRAAVRDPQLADDVLRGGVALDVMHDALRELRPLRPIASLRAIPQPVWLVNGVFDHFRWQERAYLKAARHGTLIRVPGATHMVSLTRSPQFTAVLMDTLARVAAHPARW